VDEVNQGVVAEKGGKGKDRRTGERSELTKKIRKLFQVKGDDEKGTAGIAVERQKVKGQAQKNAGSREIRAGEGAFCKRADRIATAMDA